MQGKKTFKYRIYANKITIQKAENWLELCRNLYNTALEQRIDVYHSHHRSISCYGQIYQLPELRVFYPEYKNVGSQVLEDVLKRLDRAYQSFFRRVKNEDKAGFPRFKGRDRYDSFTLRQTGWKLDGRYLSIRNVGRFKLKLSRPIEGTIKQVTIRRDNTKWYVSFACNDVPFNPLPPSDKFIAIDVGLESFLTTSDGTKIDNPRIFKQSQAILAMRQRRLSRRIKGSNRRRKARILVAKAHEQIRNQRRDFHFKLANQLLKYYGVIYIEKLKSWRTFRTLNKSMRDVAWFGFFEILKAKAEEAGREVIEVPARNTSQLCSRCGVKVPKDLSIRIHSCPSCGLTIDRDYNAALNILRLGQSLQTKSLAPSLA